MFDEQSLAQVGAWLHDAGYRFVTGTPATHARVVGRRSALPAATLRDVFGWSVPFEQSILPARIFSLLEQSDCIEDLGGRWRSKVRYSTLGNCLYMHSAYPTADADAVFFGPDTYRFATLIQQTMAKSPANRTDCIVDVGCGGGAGGIVAIKSLKTPSARVILTDINPSALKFARVNVALAGIDRVSYCEGDLFDPVDQPIDLIVANPPYLLDSQARLYRHGGGELGSDLSTRIVREGLPRLAADGTLILYTGAPVVDGEDTFWRSVEAVTTDPGLRCEYFELDPDVFGEELEFPAYSRVERIAAVALVIRRSPATAKDRAIAGRTMR